MRKTPFSIIFGLIRNASDDISLRPPLFKPRKRVLYFAHTPFRGLLVSRVHDVKVKCDVAAKLKQLDSSSGIKL